MKLKYEKDPGVQKVIVDSIEWYLRNGGTNDNNNNSNDNTNLTGMFGVDASLLKYLKDPNPEVRKYGVKIASGMDYNPEMLKTFMNMLKTEKDKGVKTEIQKAIDKFVQEQKTVTNNNGLQNRR